MHNDTSVVKYESQRFNRNGTKIERKNIADNKSRKK